MYDGVRLIEDMYHLDALHGQHIRDQRPRRMAYCPDRRVHARFVLQSSGQRSNARCSIEPDFELNTHAPAAPLDSDRSAIFGRCAAELHRIVRSRRFCSHASDRVQRKRERFRIHFRWKTQIGGQPEFGCTGDAMHPAGQFVLAQHPRREVAGSAEGEKALQPEPTDVDRERGAHEVRKCQAVLGKELCAPIDIDVVACRFVRRFRSWVWRRWFSWPFFSQPPFGGSARFNSRRDSSCPGIARRSLPRTHWR